MATYYVRTDGNDTNTGLGSTAAQAWQTIGKALGASGIGSGDTLYIAPGTYRQASTITVGGTYSAMTYVYGDPKGMQFSGVAAGLVRITTFADDTTAASSTTLFTITGKSNLTFANIFAESGTGYGFFLTSTCDNIVVQDCVITVQGRTANQSVGFYASVNQVTTGITVERCQFFGGHTALAFNPNTTAGQNFNVYAYDNICDGFTTYGIAILRLGGVSDIRYGSGAVIVNNIIVGGTNGFATAMFETSSVRVRNNIVINSSTAGMTSSASSTAVLASNNVVLQCASNYSGITSTGGRTAGVYGFDVGEQFKFGLATLMRFTNWIGSPNIAAGSSTNAPASDQYNVTWYSTTPDIGAITYRNVQNILPTYQPTERNASTITIAPGSTSQSIELYLGATGLTASTSGLTARYNRTRTASVSIPLVARTIAQAWTSGGFAEVDATNMPGVYRLDLPDAALAAGADDVTIVVRGASGTNGAVMTIKLSSGGLTSAQTAAAVLDALTDDHQIHGTFGYNLLRADAPSKEGLVTLHQSGGISRVDADVHAIANDTDAATELKGALLHNGTDYISADLLTPVSAATSVHIGPYQLMADGLGADQPLDVNVGTATSIDVQVTDANGTGIDITGATVTAKVYNAGGTLVATYSGTATYADNGRLSFGLTTTVTNTSGTYTVTVTRTTGATDTQVFGPLKLYVRPV